MKKSLKKIVSLAIASLMSMTFLSSCAKTLEKAPEKSTDVQTESTVANVDTGKIIMATNAEFPPFEFMTNSDALIDNFSGIDVAIALEIAAHLGKELQISNMEFDSVLAAVPNGAADFAAAGMTIKPERLEVMDFSIPYFDATQVMIVAENNDTIKNANDILDKKVGAVESYTGEDMCREMGVADLKSYKQGPDAIMDLVGGRLDVVVLDSKTTEALLKTTTGLKVIEDSENFETEQYAIAVKKGNTELLNEINAVLEKLIADGKIDEFALKFAGSSN